jgi:hypothetical protein
MSYNARIFPMVTGGPGVKDTMAITVTAGATSTPVKSQATRTAYNAASDADKLLHDRFSDVVQFITQYANPVSISTNADNVITLGFDRAGLFNNAGIGRPGNFTENGNPRANAFDLAAAYVASNDHGVTVMTITINGAAQGNTNL